MIGKAMVIAITGTISSGKSLVGSLLKQRGFPVIDTDEIVHQLFASSTPLKDALRREFGNSVISIGSGDIDRVKLGELVFGNEEARKKLESIVHPATIDECARQVSLAAKESDKVFVLVPLLFEAGQQNKYDEAWTIKTDEAILRDRLKKRNNLTESEIDRRLAAQLPQEEKIRRAQRVIDNSGTISDTTQQVEELLKLLGDSQ